MFQTLDGHFVYVIQIAEVPNQPLTDGGNDALLPYAEAFNIALEQGLITGPGKYAIEVSVSDDRWNVYHIKE